MPDVQYMTREEMEASAAPQPESVASDVQFFSSPEEMGAASLAPQGPPAPTSVPEPQFFSSPEEMVAASAQPAPEAPAVQYFGSAEEMEAAPRFDRPDGGELEIPTIAEAEPRQFPVPIARAIQEIQVEKPPPAEGERGFVEATKEAFTLPGVGRRLPFSPIPALEASGVYQAAKLVSSGAPDPETLKTDPEFAAREFDTAKQTVTTYLQDLQQKKKRGQTWGAYTADILTQMPGFMLEFLATGGAAALAKRGVTTAFGKSLSAGAKKTLAARAGKQVAKIVAAGAMRTAFMPHRVAEKLAQQGVDKFVVGDKVDLTFTDLAKAWTDVAIENISEESGAAMSAALRKIPFVKTVMGAYTRKFPGKAVPAVLDRLGFHGVIEEIGEEELAKVLRAVTGIEEYRVTTLKELAAQAVAFSVPGAIGAVGARMEGQARQEVTDAIQEQEAAPVPAVETPEAVPAVAEEIREAGPEEAEAPTPEEAALARAEAREGAVQVPASVEEAKEMLGPGTTDEAAQRFFDLSNRDLDTGLWNKSAFRRNLGNATFAAAMDLNLFKSNINDKFGHEVGDTVIGFVGELMKDTSLHKSASDVDAFYRPGGDEFAVLTEGSKNDIDKAVQQVHNAIDKLEIYTEDINGKQERVKIDFEAVVGPAEQFSELDREVLRRKRARGVARDQVEAGEPGAVRGPEPSVLGRERPEVPGPEVAPVATTPETEAELAEPDQPELTRQPGFREQAGSIGVQPEASLETLDDPDVRATQEMFDAQRATVQEKFGFSPRKELDKLGSRLWDVAYPFKRRLRKNSLGRDAIVMHDLSRGGSGKALTEYERAEADIYSTVPKQYDELFADILQAHRTIEVERLARERGTEALSPGGINAQQSQKWLDMVQVEHSEAWPGLMTAAEKFWDHTADPLDALAGEGVVSAELHATLKAEHKNYFPRLFIQHMDPEGQGFDTQGRKIDVPNSGIKALEEGSDQALINNPRMLLGQVQARAWNRIFRNRANKALLNYVRENPDNELGITIAQPVGTRGQLPALPADQTAVHAMVGGQPVEMRMPNDVAKFWVSSDPKMANDFADMLGTVSGAKILRMMATGINPGFAVANLPRDLAFSYYRTDEYSPILPVGWAQQAVDLATVAKDVWGRKGRVKDYIDEGGSMDFLSHQGRLGERFPGATKSATSEAIQKTQEIMGYLNETSELWTRIALRERALKKGRSPTEATWIARTYLDFAQGGSWVKAADKAIPYLNAGVQGTRGMIETMRDNPKVATAKLLQLTALAIGLATWNRKRNKEAWESISDSEKARKWIITTPLSYTDANGEKRWFYIGIPKDQGQRIFAAFGQALAERAAGETVNTRQLAMAASDFSPVDISSVPPTFAAMWAYMNNYDFWTKDEIWKGRDVEPQEEYWNTTPETAVLWGKATGMSPERSRRAFHKLVPQNVYTYLTGSMIDQMFGTMPEKAQEQAHKTMAAKIAEIPGAKRVWRQTWPQHKRRSALAKKANSLGVALERDDGSPLGVQEISSRIRTAEREQNTMRHRNDQHLQLLVSEAILTGNRQTVTEWLKTVQPYRERQRLGIRFRRMYREERKRRR
jgi:diguanylate cyclase (GGDEF)-like protein